MKQVSFGYTDTPITGVSELNFPRGLINFDADFDVVSNSPSEMTLINVTTPRSKPEKVRIAYSVIPDIYKNVDMSNSVKAGNVSGVSVLVQLTQVGTITDTVDASYEAQVPISVHLVLRVPAIEQITEAHILAAVGRLVSNLFETGSTTESRLKRILRGSLVPNNL